ncbi:MAG: hypothetical protein A2937_02890 [Candidatus Yonathbacteria bacterium RIFCSPLOWO2_01_FULL_47_33b]|uniref:FMN-binding domain-containing protein n=1 Tax=Candidatus Yonathbacteria bacterium RIFCSPLOWO2_01_FULL_47_33b TaxID=1802727 RepID=A0A1G2SGG6_9BACT|nr:MAG: hypothetical protein A2937_02890 [Candidatus Yonathbacteria bacterium RIFCSPLOWO2_01_FULL_47_33b]
MTPFKKNLQRFFILFFSTLSVGIIIVGVNRAKKVPTLGEAPTPLTPTPDQGTAGTPGTMVAGTTVSITGKTYQTPYGNVTAAIQVKDGKVVGVTMPQVPNSPPSIYAESYLVDQAIKAGGANIQGVSGATYTSLAFKSSLESAIAQAKTQGQTITTGTASTGSSAVAPGPKPSVPLQYRGDDDDEGEEWDD